MTDRQAAPAEPTTARIPDYVGKGADRARQAWLDGYEAAQSADGPYRKRAYEQGHQDGMAKAALSADGLRAAATEWHNAMRDGLLAGVSSCACSRGTGETCMLGAALSAEPPATALGVVRNARIVAEYWRDEMLAGDGLLRACAHPLAMVLAALDGETEPVQMGIPKDEYDRRAATYATPDASDRRHAIEAERQRQVDADEPEPR